MRHVLRFSRGMRLLIILPLFMGMCLWRGAPAQLTTQAAAQALVPSQLEIQSTIHTADGRVRVIIELSDAPLAAYHGEIAGLSATSLAATHARKLSMTAQSSVAYLSYLAAQQAAFVRTLTAQMPSAEVDHSYQVVFNGMALTIREDEIASLSQLPGVRRIYPDQVVQGAVDSNLSQINVPAIWDKLGGQAKAGQGIFVAVVDTGIRPEHPMFSGAGFTMPPGFPKGYCVSNPSDPKFACNNKLVAARYYAPVFPCQVDPREVMSPLDMDGHGSHVAGIAVGDPTTADTGFGFTTMLSGVAPAAYVMVYKVLVRGSGSGLTSSSCGAFSTIIAGLNDAVADGADVINGSLGGQPGSSPLATPFPSVIKNVTDAGVLAVFGAGNSGPDSKTIACPGCVEDALTVGGTYHGGIHSFTLDITGPGTVPSELTGIAAAPGDGPPLMAPITAPIRDALDVDPANGLGCSPFPSGAFSGRIALIQRGECVRIDKVTNATAAGALAVIISNADPYLPQYYLFVEETTIPSVLISQSDGVAMRNWLTTHPSATARLNTTNSLVIYDTLRDRMYDFSSLGPNGDPNILKPDITAPGVDVLSAFSPESLGSTISRNYAILSGTSMATPHVTGAAALLLQLHPTWTPRQIKTALTSSAIQTVRTTDGTAAATPFQMGAGRLDLDRASQVGITFDAPSFADSACNSTCSWTRTVESVLTSPATWTITTKTASGLSVTVTPSQFTLMPSAKQTLTVTASVVGLAPARWYFGEVILQPNLTSTVDAHLPLAVQPAGAALPARLHLPTIQH